MVKWQYMGTRIGLWLGVFFLTTGQSCYRDATVINELEEDIYVLPQFFYNSNSDGDYFSPVLIATRDSNRIVVGPWKNKEGVNVQVMLIGMDISQKDTLFKIWLDSNVYNHPSGIILTKEWIDQSNLMVK